MAITSVIPAPYRLRFWGNHNCQRVVYDQARKTAAFTHHAERDTNQDGLLVHLGQRNVLAVADGLGGRSGGEVASELALGTLADGISENTPLFKLIERANQRIIAARGSNSALAEMGTTLTAAEITGDQLFVAHVGDSRAYSLPGDGRIGLMTNDHSEAGSAFGNSPKLPFWEIKKYYTYTRDYAARRNKVWNSLGNAYLEIEIAAVSLSPGDRLLLATDGLNRLPYLTLEMTVDNDNDVPTTAERLWRARRSMPPLSSGDNFSFILHEH